MYHKLMRHFTLRRGILDARLRATDAKKAQNSIVESAAFVKCSEAPWSQKPPRSLEINMLQVVETENHWKDVLGMHGAPVLQTNFPTHKKRTCADA
jgi:hypothetical protein